MYAIRSYYEILAGRGCDAVDLRFRHILHGCFLLLLFQSGESVSALPVCQSRLQAHAVLDAHNPERNNFV